MNITESAFIHLEAVVYW